MARPLHKLSSNAPATKAPGKYADGGGLWLHKRKDGGAQWVLRVTVHGRRREMGLGSFPAVSLKEAREEPEEAGHGHASKAGASRLEVPLVPGAIARVAKSGCKILPRAVPETGRPVAAQRTVEAGMSRSKKTNCKQTPAKQYEPTDKEKLAVDTVVE